MLGVFCQFSTIEIIAFFIFMPIEDIDSLKSNLKRFFTSNALY